MLPRFSTKTTVHGRDPRGVVKVVLSVLAGLNLIAGYFYFFPPGGSASELDAALAQTRAQIQRGRASLELTKTNVRKVQSARLEQEQFVTGYFLDRRTASSTILSEIGKLAKNAGLTPREHSFAIDPVEGSDEFSMMTITGNYEGNYADLVEFVNAVDRSPRFLIIDSITAQPQQSGGLQARFKMNAFLRESGGPPIPATPPSDVTAQNEPTAEVETLPLRPVSSPSSTPAPTPDAPKASPFPQGGAVTLGGVASSPPAPASRAVPGRAPRPLPGSAVSGRATVPPAGSTRPERAPEGAPSTTPRPSPKGAAK
ncbi:MAG: type 4a pilus biogenesis protein PilO [Bryobacterales bacterium]|nr:type 4a pilus biogenesis protein PilO [Bryobacterales bacterium]